MAKTKRKTVSKRALDQGFGLESMAARALIRACAAEGRTPAAMVGVLKKAGITTTEKGVRFFLSWEAENQRLIANYAQGFETPAKMEDTARRARIFLAHFDQITAYLKGIWPSAVLDDGR